MNCLPCQRGSRRHRPDSGAALVEFALVLPIFALMLFAMVQFGVLFAGWAQLRNAVQTGARMASVGQSSPQCGSLSQPACTVAVLIGAPTGLTSPGTVVNSVSIERPERAQCDLSLSNCADASWLDGYYIYLNGAWKQIVSATTPSPSVGQVTDGEALLDGGTGTWTCASASTQYCTRISTTSAAGANDPALGSDYQDIAVECDSGSCAVGSQVFVCARLAATPLTGLLPKMSVSTESTFYIETGTATTINQGGISCG